MELNEKVYADDISGVTLMLDKGVDPNECPEYPPLFYAKSRAMVVLLVSRGANVNTVDDLHENALFQVMCPEITLELIKQGADMSLLNHNRSDLKQDTRFWMWINKHNNSKLQLLEKKLAILESIPVLMVLTKLFPIDLVREIKSTLY
jgi:hypothetical protein